MLDDLLHVLQLVSPSFLIIGLGFLFARQVPIDPKPLVRLTMALLLPCFAFHHISGMNLEGGLLGNVFLSAWIILLLPGFLAWLILRRRKEIGRGVYLPIMFMNSVNLPFPIMQAAYGDTAIPFGLMFFLASFVAVFTIGLFLVSSESGWQQIFKEPVVYLVALALAINTFGTPLPAFVREPVRILAGANIPMVLLILGMHLAQVKVTQLRLTWMVVGFRFSFGLLAGLLCVTILPLDDLARKVVLLESIMPCAVINILLSGKYNANPELVASSILVSTLLALAIIPATLLMLG
ncbi:AEC family transporter [Nitrospina gracilis]|uniref:AEC family transporter n=1 Tax=Nitrospina gracilis TaxID=35801 RepID=UPI001F1E58B7|nr:AEC family transporter [Nitrospina gracilis]MCF8720940.1 putative permease [Nitrospina gracilis Nb-211]